MPEIDKETVIALLEEIQVRQKRLMGLSSVSYAEYAKTAELRDQVERNFEVIIQCCIDLANHLLAAISEKTPHAYRDIFLLLAEHGVISQDLAEKLARMAGFRNLLVHGYLRLDHKRVHGNLSNLGDIEGFVRAITVYLETQGLFGDIRWQ